MLYFDTETCGFHGPIVLFQFAVDDGDTQLYSPWKSPIQTTIDLFESITEDTVVGFNLVFDWFHICQMYTTLLLMDNKEEILQNCLDEYAHKEKIGRDGPCLKPKSAFDVMMYARKGPYQITMSRKPVKIRRVPVALSFELCKILEEKISFRNILFAKRKDKFAPHWKIKDIEGTGDFKDLELKFAPSSALKMLWVDIFGEKEIDLFGEVGLHSKFNPVEYTFAPFYFGEQGQWPDVIEEHIDHWVYDTQARKYAANDVNYTRDIYKYFGSPAHGDDDSVLACALGAIRWKGYKINVEGLKELITKEKAKRKNVPTAPRRVAEYIKEVLDPIEAAVFKSTKKVILENLTKMGSDCPECDGDSSEPNSSRINSKEIGSKEINCPRCNGTGEVKHPAGIRAEEILDSRKAKYRIDLYQKLIKAGRFHPAMTPIGALSGRMSGGDSTSSSKSINPQGIPSLKEVREQFLLAFDDEKLEGGDFDSFEVSIADAVYSDPKLHSFLEKGGQIHAVMGTFAYPGKTYDDIMKSKKTELDLYKSSKSGVFAIFYGGEVYTLMTRLGVSREAAEKAFMMLINEFPGIKKNIAKIKNTFGALSQPDGIGKRVFWKDPAEASTTMFGFARYFTVEIMVMKALFQLSNNVPKSWQDLKFRVTRRDREQTVSGAAKSALIGSAFQIQGAIIRAATNHEIQGAGAEITKKVQRKIWDLQPHGSCEWKVRPMNIHDELMCPTKLDHGIVKQVVDEVVEELRPKVPLLKIAWTGLTSWADKS